MKEETTNYDQVTLDPNKPVLVDIRRYVPITNTIKASQERGTRVYREVVFSWFDKNTHAPLSKKNQRKLSQEDLEKRFYNTVDIDATEKNVKYFLDEVAFAALKLEGEFRGIFKDNIDSGNSLPRAVQPPVELPVTDFVGEPDTATENSQESNES